MGIFRGEHIWDFAVLLSSALFSEPSACLVLVSGPITAGGRVPLDFSGAESSRLQISDAESEVPTTSSTLKSLHIE